MMHFGVAGDSIGVIMICTCVNPSARYFRENAPVMTIVFWYNEPIPREIKFRSWELESLCDELGFFAVKCDEDVY
jgi:hypothetical protein